MFLYTFQRTPFSSWKPNFLDTWLIGYPSSEGSKGGLLVPFHVHIFSVWALIARTLLRVQGEYGHWTEKGEIRAAVFLVCGNCHVWKDSWVAHQRVWHTLRRFDQFQSNRKVSWPELFKHFSTRYPMKVKGTLHNKCCNNRRIILFHCCRIKESYL